MGRKYPPPPPNQPLGRSSAAPTGAQRPALAGLEEPGEWARGREEDAAGGGGGRRKRRRSGNSGAEPLQFHDMSLADLAWAGLIRHDALEQLSSSVRT